MKKKRDFNIASQFDYMQRIFTQFYTSKDECPFVDLFEPYIQQIWCLLQNGADYNELKEYLEYICSEITYCIYDKGQISTILNDLFFWNLTRKKNLSSGVFFNLTPYSYFFEADYDKSIKVGFNFSPEIHMKVKFYNMPWWSQEEKWFNLSPDYRYTSSSLLNTDQSIIIDCELQIIGWKRFSFILNGERLICCSYNKRFEKLRLELSDEKSKLVSCKVTKKEIFVTYQTPEGELVIVFEGARIYFRDSTFYARKFVEDVLYNFDEYNIKNGYGAAMNYYRHYNIPFLEQNLRDGSLYVVTYPLIEAVIHSNLNVIRCMIETTDITDAALVNVETFQGYTPLYFACRLGKKDIADYLISHGAKIRPEYNDIKNAHEAESLLKLAK